MKRSTSSDFKRNKKVCLSPSSKTTTMEDFKDIILHLEKGDFEYCLNNTNNDDDPISLALKQIAKNQQRLETENKRYRIAIQQQHHILTHQTKEATTSQNVNTINKGTSEDCLSSFKTSPMLEKIQLSPTSSSSPTVSQQGTYIYIEYACVLLITVF